MKLKKKLKKLEARRYDFEKTMENLRRTSPERLKGFTCPGSMKK